MDLTLELELELVIQGFLFNLVFCLAQFLAQGINRLGGMIPSRHFISRIRRGKQPFLYWQDFATQTWGGIVGLGMVHIAFAHIFEQLSYLDWYIMIAGGLVSYIAFFKRLYNKSHEPNWCYNNLQDMEYMMPLSLAGYTHVQYLVLCVGVAVGCFTCVIHGTLTSWPLVLFIIGMVIWTAAAIRDWTAGRFKAFNSILPPPK